MKYIKKFNEEYDYSLSKINEDGEGGGSGGDAGSGSGDVSGGGGVAYATKGGGLGNVQNATVSEIPGDPNGSIPGSGDVGFVLPNKTYDSPNPVSRNKGIVQSIKQIKDKLGVGKTMSFQSFLNNK